MNGEAPRYTVSSRSAVTQEQTGTDRDKKAHPVIRIRIQEKTRRGGFLRPYAVPPAAMDLVLAASAFEKPIAIRRTPSAPIPIDTANPVDPM